MFTALVPVSDATTDARPARTQHLDLNGVTVALVDNGKPRTSELLQYIAEELRAMYGITVIGPFRTDSAMVMSDAQLDDVAARCDVVLNGLGDCGSCSASSIVVSTAFETRGIPAVAICTKPFAPTARAIAARQGRPDQRFVTVAHPLSSLPDEELRERALDALPQVLDILGAREPVSTNS